jgi:hypothetical protein
MRRSPLQSLPGILLALLLAGIRPVPATAATCAADDFAAAVDKSGAQLRTFNGEALPKLRDKLKELKTAKGWGDDYEEKGLDTVRDARAEKFDSDAEELITKIDMLGRPPTDKQPDCAKLAELQAAGLELLALMKAKSAYMISKIDTEISDKPPAPPAPAQAAKEAAPAKVPAPKSPEQQVANLPPVHAPTPSSKPGKWDTKTKPQPETPMAALAVPPPPLEPTYSPPPLPPETAEQGYTIDEIHEVTRGFFGTISTSLGSVIEYAFHKLGRPDGYVLGTEGGGAFLAGVRYGSGTLYLRSGGTAKVYWHGPSIGTDFGASGSRTMFLIYNLRDPNDLIREFTGIDGSAYFVGGVGITFLKGGPVLMAPIRSGLGFRIGANLGYIRFTPRATWNPF